MDLKISQFPQLESANASAIVPIVQSGNNYTVALSSLYSRVTILSAINSQTIQSSPHFDETLVILPTGLLSALSWTLPKVTSSRVGQIKTFWSSQNITTLTVTVSGGGGTMGVPLTTANALESYSFQCILISGNGTWLRLA